VCQSAGLYQPSMSSSIFQLVAYADMVQLCIRSPADRCGAEYHARPKCGMYKSRAAPCPQSETVRCLFGHDNARLGENRRQWMANGSSTKLNIVHQYRIKSTLKPKGICS